MISSQPKVEILLATYNGERYLAEQLDSIRRQTYKNWIVTISDDCSTDETLDVIRHYEQIDSRIHLGSAGEKQGGARENFFHLMEISTEDYVMFSDQDDVWLPTKIERSMDRLVSTEAVGKHKVPVLVSTDLEVVDERLNTIAPSFLNNEHFSHSHGTLAHCLVENNVCGCTIAANRKLIDLALRVADYRDSSIVMHDWWLLLVAKAFGTSSLVDTPLSKYRQHEANQIGTKSFSLARLVKNYNLETSCAYWNKTFNQVRAFKKTYHELLDGSASEDVINRYLSLPSMRECERLNCARRNGYLPTGASRQVGQAISFLFGSKYLTN